MLGLDQRIASLGGNSVVMALVIAVLLGLRHATDPDHLTAVSTLVLSARRHDARRATWLGLAWGLGHATTLFLFGLPVVLFRQYLPDAVQRAAEATIGVVIVALGVRLLIRWRRGYFHAHLHAHDGSLHVHPHAHERPHDGEQHAHRHGIGRTPLASYGIGLIHGAGGSAGVGILLVGSVPGRGHAVLALVLFAAATALSMAMVSTAFGYALARGPVARHLTRMIPVFGCASVLFGVWYAASAV